MLLSLFLVAVFFNVSSVISQSAPGPGQPWGQCGGLGEY
jgi:hypothetical protein